MLKTIIKGKKIRTKNSCMQEIMGLWQEIMSLHLSGEIYAVYSHYESNHLGEYDFLIGTTCADLPDTIELTATNYLEIPVENNSIENVGKTWQFIWSNEEIEAKRSYQTDFEKYSQDGTIIIYLSIK